MEAHYDVVIIGSGISGTMLGAILAKHGVNTLIIDAGTHPRFVVGESMIPESGVLLDILAARYDIPELSYPARVDTAIDHIGTSSAGIKLSFGFAWNAPHRPLKLEHIDSFPIIAPEAHLFRQDVDAYYLALAARMGATIWQQTRIQTIQETPDGMILKTGKQDIHARYVVDAAGYRSPIAKAFGLRDGAQRMQTRTRSMFTHMTNVTLFEDAIAPIEKTGMANYLAQSTLHQMFKGGWLWIIPFNNHPHSTNTLCSVGLQLDLDEYGPAGDPEQEFQQLLARYPSIAKHFEQAARVREWTVAPRLNYNSRALIGDRYCLLGHAGGFVDPLFSRGLANTFESIARVAPKLLRAIQTDHFDQRDLERYQHYGLKVVATNDRLVANSFTAFDSFPLWNAWFRAWVAGSYIGVLRWRKIFDDYQRTQDDDALERAIDETTYPGQLSLESHRFEEMFDKACTLMEAYKAGERNEQDVIRALHALYEEYKADLPVDFTDFNNRCISRSSQAFANQLQHWAHTAPHGLSEKLDRGTEPLTFDFLDDYRYGDREALARQADAANRLNNVE